MHTLEFLPIRSISTARRNSLKDYKIDKFYIEKASGKNIKDRPELQKMMDYVREGDVVYVESISRFGRSLQDLLNLINQLNDKGVQFKSIKEGDIDTTTPTGKLVFSIFASLAIISDGKKCILNFTENHHMNSEVIPVYGGKKRYKTDKDNSLSSINQLHQEIESLRHRRHGVSTRHLQGYLDWILFRKKIRYRYEARNRRSETYMKTIDLYRAYGQYHYGIFADGNHYPEGMYDDNGLLNKNYQSLN